MAFLEIAGQRKVIPDGESVIGSASSADIRIEGEAVSPDHAVLRTTADGQVAIRRASDQTAIQVNGVPLGPQPTPLLHGDKITIGPHELLFVDERRSGSTAYVQAVTPESLAAAAAAAKQARPGKPTAGTGGRLVSLTDGREYTVTSGSLVIGRDASADVVVTSREVSRRHCEIMATPKGYVLVDSSTNGSFVNGKRVDGQQVLARGDIIRTGDHEFRFYADLAPQEAAAAPPEAAAGAEHRLRDTMMGVPQAERGPRTGEDLAVREAPPPPPAAAPSPPPAAPAPQRAAPRPAAQAPPSEAAPPKAPAAARPSGAGALAFLVIRSGRLKGQRLAIRTPNVNVGRADYNDLVLPDDSVSTTHAKIQRREGIWMLVDLDSTNGSFVDGERVEGDAPLAPGALVRFGEVRAFFEPVDEGMEEQQGGSTRLLQALKLPPDA